MSEKSRMITLKDGLYKRNRCSVIFYIDYFIFRIVLSILVGLTPFVSTTILFAVAIVW